MISRAFAQNLVIIAMLDALTSAERVAITCPALSGCGGDPTVGCCQEQNIDFLYTVVERLGGTPHGDEEGDDE